MKTVKQMWNKFEAMPVSLEEVGALLNKRQKGQKLVWRTTGESLHGVTANEWAYRMVAGLRGEDFGPPTAELDFTDLERRAAFMVGQPMTDTNTGRLTKAEPTYQWVF